MKPEYRHDLIGRRVCVLFEHVVRHVGTVVGLCSPDTFVVALDNARNPKHWDGYFYFRLAELEFLDGNAEITDRAAEIKVAMRKRVEQLSDIALYEAVAKYDPEMAELLEEYQALRRALVPADVERLASIEKKQ